MTYSVAAVNLGKLFPKSITGTYEKISLCLARGLAELGIRADLAQTDTGASGRKPWTTSCCFSEPAGRELLVAGRKICGSAQVRTHGSFLQHGSMLMTFDPVETAAVILMPPEPHNMEKFGCSVTAVNQEIPVSVSAEILCRVLREGFVKELGIDLSEEPLTPAEEALSRQLVEKYESDAWNWERKKEAFKLG